MGRHTRCEPRLGTGRSIRVTNTHYTPAKKGSLPSSAASKQPRQRGQGTCHRVPQGWFRVDSLLRPCSSQGYPDDSTTTGVTPPVVAFRSLFSSRSKPTYRCSTNLSAVSASIANNSVCVCSRPTCRVFATRTSPPISISFSQTRLTVCRYGSFPEFGSQGSLDVVLREEDDTPVGPFGGEFCPPFCDTNRLVRVLAVRPLDKHRLHFGLPAVREEV